MRTIDRTNQFKRDYKRAKRGNPKLDELLVPVIEQLAADGELPERLRDHTLSGEWKGYRECHVRPDLLLIYTKPPQSLRLIRLGSHSELFD